MDKSITHLSKIDNRVYHITEDKFDDITLIWDDNEDQRRLVNWHWGGYDYELAECYVKDYLDKLNALLHKLKDFGKTHRKNAFLLHNDEIKLGEELNFAQKICARYLYNFEENKIYKK